MRQTRAAVGVGAAVLVAALGALTVVVSGDDEPTAGGAPGSSSSTAPSPSTTATPSSPVDGERAAPPVLLEPADLGPGYRAEAAGARRGPCDDGLGGSAQRVATSATSTAASQRIVEEVLTFEDAATASAEFASARERASCAGAGNVDGDGAPVGVEIDGADDAFSASFTTESDAFGLVVALVDDRIAVFTVELHQGAAVPDGLGAREVARRGVALLRDVNAADGRPGEG